MKFISTAEAAENWSVSQRRIRVWCKEGRISNARLVGSVWQIPEDAKKPSDRRTAEGKDDNCCEIPLYLAGDATLCERVNPCTIGVNEKRICEIITLMLQGKLFDSKELLDEYLDDCDETYRPVALLVNFLLCIYLGDKMGLASTGLKLKKRYLLNNSGILNSFLDVNWNKMNINLVEQYISNENMPMFLYSMDRNSFPSFMRQRNPNYYHSLILHAKIVEQTGNEEMLVYYYCMLAICLSFTKEKKLRKYYQDKALEIILRRKWWLLIAEHAYALNWSVDQYVDESTLEQIHELTENVSVNLISGVFADFIPHDKSLSHTMMIQIAFRMACNYTQEEIAREFKISIYTLNKYISRIYEVCGATNRAELEDAILNRYSYF